MPHALQILKLRGLDSQLQLSMNAKYTYINISTVKIKHNEFTELTLILPVLR